ncbi:tyrosine recombinase XerC [Hahella sp. KA22]|nr:tyrosine recombinase XerC [Hahella sp. KA22]QAY53273.1 tyrosine recombinase XerC [Hahella sp. KA22]
MSLSTQVEAFIAYLHSERRYSVHTVSNYNRDLRRVVAYCEASGVATWKDLHTPQLRQALSEFHRCGLGSRSLHRLLSTVRRFYEYLLRERVVYENPANGVHAPKMTKRLPATMDVDQAKQLLDSPVDDEELEIRDQAIAELFYTSGMRLSELAGLDLTHLDLSEGLARVLGKGGKERLVPVGGQARKALQDWLQTRASLAGAGEPAVFVSLRGTRLSRRSIQARLRQWAQKKGFSGRLYPHLFRHSCASHLLESSGDLRAVQELLGHADISTTQIYTHLNFQHLAEVYDKAHPRARKRKTD